MNVNSPAATHSHVSHQQNQSTFPIKSRWTLTVIGLLRKNLILLWSSKLSLLVMLMLPSLGVGFTKTINRATQNWINSVITKEQSAPEFSTQVTIVDDGTPLEACQWFDVYGKQTNMFSKDCVTLLFTVSSSNTTSYGNTLNMDIDEINKIMSEVAKESGLMFSPMSLDSTVIPAPPFQQQIFGVSSLYAIGEFMSQHPGRAAGVVVWRPNQGDKLFADTWYNTTSLLGNNQPATINRLRAVLTRGFLKGVIGKEKVEVVIQTRKSMNDSSNIPEISGNPYSNFDIDDFIVASGATQMGRILALAFMLSNALLYSVFLAREKQEGLIGSLRVAGMTDSAYWASWLIIGIGIAISSSFLAIILAYMIDAPVLTQTNFIIPWILLTISSICMYAFGTLAVGLVTQRRAVYGIQFLAFFLVVVSASLGGYFPGAKSNIVIHFFFLFIPGYHLTKVSRNIGTYKLLSKSYKNVTLTYSFINLFDRIGECNRTILEFEDRCEYIKVFDNSECWDYNKCHYKAYAYGDVSCAPDKCYFFPISDALSLLIMIIQTLITVVLTWYFFIVIPSGNGICRKPWFLFNPFCWKPVLSLSEVALEMKHSKDELSIRIRNMSAVFGNHKALDEINLEMANGQVFVILGHNGAGKTTLINLLTGMVSPSSGDAYIMGHSVIHDIGSIQGLVGSVPQYDRLWNELSAYEHIRLFATIKGIVWTDEINSREAAIASILENVNLGRESKRAAGGYSGGMKRRLSIALACVGNPSILLMDEPTTGVDPLNRRRIWKLIEELKKDRVIVLTTHLMQEADSLGDYIAILDHGHVQAQGTPLNLKAEYGSGYTLSVLTNTDKVGHVRDLAKQAIPDVHLISSSAGSIKIGIPQESLDNVPKLTQDLQAEELIREWSVSQSTLEEVFLRLVKHNSVPNVAEVSVVPDIDNNEQTGLEYDYNDVVELPFEDEHVEVTFTTTNLWILQTRSLLWKAFLLQQRSFVGTLVLFLVPSIGMLLLSIIVFDTKNVLVDGEVILAPQTTTYIWPSQSNGTCNFNWSLFVDIDGYFDPIRHYTTPTGWTTLFESNQFPPDVDAHVTLEWSIKIVSSNMTLACVISAVQESFREELKRTDNPEDQGIADAECKGKDFCGPCHVDLATWRVTVSDENTFSFSFYRQSGFKQLERYPQQQCIPLSNECPFNLIRFLILQESFMRILSEQMAAPVWLVTQPFYTYPDAFMSLDPPIVSSRFVDSTSCEDLGIILWLSGEGAASLAEQMQGNRTQVVMTDENVISLIESNQLDLKIKMELFENTKYSACVNIFWTGMRDPPRGWIVNKDAPAIIGYESDWCSFRVGLLDAYHDMFPDGAIQVKSFDVLGTYVKVDVVSVILNNKIDSDYGRYFDTSAPRVYKVYCNETAVNNIDTCHPDAELSCSVISPSPQNYPPYENGISWHPENSLLIETIYDIIIGAAQNRSLHMNVMSESLNWKITYTPALSTTHLAKIASMFALIIGMLMPTTISTIVFEKHQRQLFSMLMNGLALSNYWISAYIFHTVMCLMIVMFSVMLGVALCFAFFEDLQYSYFTLVVFSYIHAQFGFITLLSTLFSDEKFAGTFLTFGSIILFGIAWITLTSMESLLNHWPPVMSLVPMLGASRAFFLLFWNHFTEEVLQISGILLGSGTLYLIIGIYIHGTTGVGALWKPMFHICKNTKYGNDKENNEVDNTVQRHDNNDKEVDMECHDSDVQQEAIRSHSLSHNEVAIKITHLSKAFPSYPVPKHAVIDLSMAMDYGEIFGLLGPNGAGKTTVISMLVGQLDPSEGAAYISGSHSVYQRQEVLKEIGIVHQFDILYPELSVSEHLQMYGGLKGVTKKDSLEWALYIAKKVALGGELFHRPCKNLSGGMKRRLSIAIALLSNPKILFLDEPTTGLDPAMKQSIWEIIEQMQENRCIVLTTHAMDEAEALCTRVGIMAEGRLKCIGTLLQLQKRYGGTFELTFMGSQSKRDLDDFLNHFSESAKCVSSFGQTLVYTIDNTCMDLTSLLTMILQGKDQGLYSGWGISNTSLDEVFCAVLAESEGVFES